MLSTTSDQKLGGVWEQGSVLKPMGSVCICKHTNYSTKCYIVWVLVLVASRHKGPVTSVRTYGRSIRNQPPQKILHDCISLTIYSQTQLTLYIVQITFSITQQGSFQRHMCGTDTGVSCVWLARWLKRAWPDEFLKLRHESWTDTISRPIGIAEWNMMILGPMPKI